MINQRLKRRFQYGVGVALLLTSIVSVAAQQAELAEGTQPEPNAYDFFVRAGDLVNHRHMAGVDTSPDKLRAAIADNGEALRVLREGFQHKYMLPAVWTAACQLVICRHGSRMQKGSRNSIMAHKVKATL